MSVRVFGVAALGVLAGLVMGVTAVASNRVESAGPGDAKTAAGLKEALQIGAANAVSLTGQVDGYFKNQAIKILMPKQLQSLEKGLRAVGKEIFAGAIGEITFGDARQILTGGDTAATDYFKSKTTDKLTAAFRPAVEKTMNETGVTRQYKELVGRFKAIPFAKSQSFDIDQYVVSKALDGLFYVLGEEERKIRKNPAARVTSLLKDVFGR